jgi:phage-related protein
VPTQAVFYRDAQGREPVWDFLSAELTASGLKHVERQIEDMNGIADQMPPPPFPQTSQIRGGPRELRCHSGRELFRIIYRRSGNLLVLLHVIRKGSRTIPERDIELAEKRWQDFKRRMNSTERRGPRAVGRDAP